MKIVQKFGGTSVADIDRIRHVSKIVKNEIDNGFKLVIIVSAKAGITNMLTSECRKVSELNSESHMREYDAVLSTGEIVSAGLLALQLQNIGVNAKSFQAWQLNINTNQSYSSAKIIDIGNEIQKIIDDGVVPVITGFQGISQGDVTTLGKGGSDITAVAIAASIDARCDIYTDIDGIYSADPRIVNNAHRIHDIDSDIVYTLCRNGAFILHHRAALIAKRYQVEMRILSSFNSNFCTKIRKKTNMEKLSITAITSNKNLVRVNIRSVNLIMQEFAKIIPVDSYIEDGSIVLIVDLSKQQQCKKILDELKMKNIIESYVINPDISTVSIIGYSVNDLFPELLNLTLDANIKIYRYQTSEVQISFMINESDTEEMVRMLHNYCFR